MSDLHGVIQELDALGCEPEQMGDQWSAYCPVHEVDGQRHKKSLSIKAGDKVDVVVTCHAGCSFTALRNAITGLSTTKLGKEVETVYPYRDRNGKELFRKIRFWPKDFKCENHNIQKLSLIHI